MTLFRTKQLPVSPDAVAPDGSDVRTLLALEGGGMSHFELSSGHTSTAVTHRTVGEIWFVLSGSGEMWRKQGEHEETVLLEPGVCLTIPLGTHFQFRASATEAFSAIGTTMPPWPGKGEAVDVAGPWEPSSR